MSAQQRQRSVSNIITKPAYGSLIAAAPRIHIEIVQASGRRDTQRFQGIFGPIYAPKQPGSEGTLQFLQQRGAPPMPLRNRTKKNTVFADNLTYLTSSPPLCLPSLSLE